MTSEAWKIHPKESVGPLALNAPSEDFQPILGNEYDCFSRAGGSQMLAYDSQGVHIEIEENGETRAITVFEPCCVTLEGVALIGRETTAVERDLEVTGVPFQLVDAGLWNSELLIMIISQDGRVDGVEVRRVPY